jgi:hypothetical protein
MRNSTSVDTPNTSAARARISDAIRRATLAEVARKLGVDRAAVASFVVGSCREGTSVLIVSRIDRLEPATLAPTGTG